jgi:hypothetical protein
MGVECKKHQSTNCLHCKESCEKRIAELEEHKRTGEIFIADYEKVLKEAREALEMSIAIEHFDCTDNPCQCDADRKNRKEFPIKRQQAIESIGKVIGK